MKFNTVGSKKMSIHITRWIYNLMYFLWLSCTFNALGQTYETQIIETVVGQNLFLICSWKKSYYTDLFKNNKEYCKTYTYCTHQNIEISTLQFPSVSFHNVTKSNSASYKCESKDNTLVFNLKVFDNQITNLTGNAPAYKKQNNTYVCIGNIFEPLVLKWFHNHNLISNVFLKSGSFSEVIDILPNGNDFTINVTCQVETFLGQLRGFHWKTGHVFEIRRVSSLERFIIDFSCKNGTGWFLGANRQHITSESIKSNLSLLNIPSITLNHSDLYWCFSPYGNVLYNLTVHKNHLYLNGSQIHFLNQNYSMILICSAKTMLNIVCFKNEIIIYNNTLNLTNQKDYYKIPLELTSSNSISNLTLKCQGMAKNQLIGEDTTYIEVIYSPIIIIPFPSYIEVNLYQNILLNVTYCSNPATNQTLWTKNNIIIHATLKKINATCYTSSIEVGNKITDEELIYNFTVSNIHGSTHLSTLVRKKNSDSRSMIILHISFALTFLIIFFCFSGYCLKQYLIFYELNRKWPQAVLTPIYQANLTEPEYMCPDIASSSAVTFTSEKTVRLPSTVNSYVRPPCISWADPEEMTISLNKRLGEGCFGYVYQAIGKIPPKNKRQKVAVKITKDGQDEKVYQNFLQEIRIHRSIPVHSNVVTFIGLFYQQGGLGMVMEFVSGGNLKDYLMNFHKRPFWRKSSAFSLSSNQLLLYSRQIAMGMSHLNKHNIIHRDLAARNILLANNICKISDFGLARDVAGTETEIYTMHEQSKVPVRWLALECLLFNTYTSKSDVWSYGITIWEIVTLGLPPYPDIETAEEVVAKVMKGYRMKPSNCATEVYNIMLQCWAENSSDRPEFTQIIHWIDQLLSQNTIYINFNIDFINYENVTPDIFREEFNLSHAVKEK